MPVPVDSAFRATLLAALAAAAACSGNKAEPDVPAVDPEPPSPLTLQEPAPLPEPEGAEALPGGMCSPGAPIGPGIVPAQQTDGLVVVHRKPVRPEGALQTWEVGTPCSGASDMAACKESLASLPSQPIRQDCGQIGCFEWFVATTSGDEVRWHSTENTLLLWLGTIDSASDAQSLIWARGYNVDCGSIQPVKGGWHVEANRRVSDCPVTEGQYEMLVAPDGNVMVVKEDLQESGACIGRLPPGLRSLPADRRADVGAWLARAAHLEQSAVHAFDVLVGELQAHGAPEHLIAACREARADEVRHAADVGALAVQLGGRVAPVEVDDGPVRSVLELALDNAREGLARETLGAAIGLYQAKNAELAEVRALMTRVAQDEIRHAELSRALHAWYESQLSSEERAQVDAARMETAAALVDGTLAQREDAMTRALGLPTGAAAAALVQVIAQA